MWLIGSSRLWKPANICKLVACKNIYRTRHWPWSRIRGGTQLKIWDQVSYSWYKANIFTSQNIFLHFSSSPVNMSAKSLMNMLAKSLVNMLAEALVNMLAVALGNTLAKSLVNMLARSLVNILAEALVNMLAKSLATWRHQYFVFVKNVAQWSHYFISKDVYMGPGLYSQSSLFQKLFIPTLP